MVFDCQHCSEQMLITGYQQVTRGYIEYSTTDIYVEMRELEMLEGRTYDVDAYCETCGMKDKFVDISI